MALIYELEKQGNWLFKRRGWLPLLFLIPAIIYLWLSNSTTFAYNKNREIIFLFVGLFGQFIRAITVGRTPSGTSGRNTSAGQIADELNTTGIYSMLRHPLYLGNYFMWIAPVLLLNSLMLSLLFSLAYWLYYERIMFAEEQFLRRKFDDAYDNWSVNVRAFIPVFKYFRKSKLKFSFLNVLKREYHGFANMFVAFALIDLARNYFIEQRLMLNPLWLWPVIIVLAIWTIIRIIVKFTKLFEVSGR